jgi:AraC family transcriptional regulator, regulatory protein of adaptative response / methylated-DNA-[protein]-cysteine methyltransferase
MEPRAGAGYLPGMNESALQDDPGTPLPRTTAPQVPDEETAWAAVLARASRFDGLFVYAVSTTGIYCRPSCPARRPRRDNVAFFARPAAAESAGFRACRRCHPDASLAGVARIVDRVLGFLAAHRDEPVTLAALSRAAGLSPHHLQRVFKRATGLSPKEYAEALRTRRFKASMRRERSVTTAIYEAGYGSGSRAYESAHAKLGMTPATYRRGGQGMEIRYATVTSPLGRLIVAATDRGVCSVQLGASDAALQAALRDEYPRAELRSDDGRLRPWVDAILQHLAGGMPRLDLPLDVQATAFQWSVWKELQRIPYGSRRSYAEVARALGRPRAVRAVAGACARNRVALLVPCHRVIASDGELGGYRWGKSRKRRLLEMEKARATR